MTVTAKLIARMSKADYLGKSAVLTSPELARPQLTRSVQAGYLRNLRPTPARNYC